MTAKSYIIIGEGALTVECAKILASRGYHCKAAITTHSELVSWAGINGAACYESIRDFTVNLGESNFSVSYVFSIANLSVVPHTITALAKEKAINFHDGPLPRYAGIHATSWAIIHGERLHGVTWHEMETDLDKGNILVQEEVAVAANDTAYSLNTKCFEAGLRSFRKLIDEIESGSLLGKTQAKEGWSYFGKFQRPVDDGIIDWSQPSKKIEALVRALEFGPYPNRLASAKALMPDRSLIVVSQCEKGEKGKERAGEVIKASEDEVCIATEDGSIKILKASRLCGLDYPLGELIDDYDLKKGSRLLQLEQEERRLVSDKSGTIARAESWWVSQVHNIQEQDFYFLKSNEISNTTDYLDKPLPFLIENKGHEIEAISALFVLLSRITGGSRLSIGLSQETPKGLGGLYEDVAPLNLEFGAEQTIAETIKRVSKQHELIEKKGSWMKDIFSRHPEIERSRSVFDDLKRSVVIDFMGCLKDPRAAIFLTVDAGNKLLLRWDVRRVRSWDASQLADSFEKVLLFCQSNVDTKVLDVDLVSDSQRKWLLEVLNPEDEPIPTGYILSDFECRAKENPKKIAAVFREASITYGELNARANKLARHLQTLGVGEDIVVGIFMDRSLDLLIALYGTLKAGGAYLPLDPTYPPDRLAFMLEDSKAKIILTNSAWDSKVPETQAVKLRIEEALLLAESHLDENLGSAPSSLSLAYVIYTSGSTGKPKGVMVTHENAVNFFLGMDQRIGNEPGVWLAVTSISFDISVLELFWTLNRGFKVVLAADEDRLDSGKSETIRSRAKPIDFGLFFFASDLEPDPKNRYRLLLEGAKFGDQNEFNSIWTPERHFHSFGGLYPNPSVASAGIATMTNRIKIRSGSVVAPLHHPVRIAEEWSLVDNLSQGRVGISFAAGWQPNDFLLRPENYAERKNIMFEQIETIRKLWRGESQSFEGADGKEVAIKIYPTPIQDELPFWITTAGNPETFKMAGASGGNLLTHLLGQKIEEVGEKIKIYREARAEAGYEGSGSVTLMLHTFVGQDTSEVKEIVRKPMCEYLRTAVDLVKNAPYTFPTFKVPKAEVAAKVDQGLRDFSEQEMEALLEFAFDRYFDTSGLFGSVDRCLDIVERCQQIDVDEIGCLIDFGVPMQKAIDGFQELNEVRQRSQLRVSEASQEKDYSLLAQMRDHQVTHFQCTPSMARMLANLPQGMNTLSRLDRIMLGGEALPNDLVSTLRSTVSGEIHNMYGPTETTIWSTTDKLPKNEDFITIGRPIANTQVYIVDNRLNLLPPGAPGELLIGGAGVTRGYFDRPNLTGEKFIDDRYLETDRKVYRTGDLAAWREDGRLDFLGRLDFQVKIRGHRIELEEIEIALGKFTRINGVVVVARPRSSGDSELLAFYLSETGTLIEAEEIRSFLSNELPEYMIPSYFVSLREFPTTPNGKIDRKKLAAIDVKSNQISAPSRSIASPSTGVEKQIAEIFIEALEIDQIGLDENFFDLGANSLSLVSISSKLGESFPGRINLVNLFQYTTLRGLVEFLSDPEDDSELKSSKGSDRGKQRRKALLQRRRS